MKFFAAHEIHLLMNVGHQTIMVAASRTLFFAQKLGQCPGQ
jgi:hypothetical protein